MASAHHFHHQCHLICQPRLVLRLYLADAPQRNRFGLVCGGFQQLVGIFVQHFGNRNLAVPQCQPVFSSPHHGFCTLHLEFCHFLLAFHPIPKSSIRTWLKHIIGVDDCPYLADASALPNHQFNHHLLCVCVNPQCQQPVHRLFGLAQSRTGIQTAGLNVVYLYGIGRFIPAWLLSSDCCAYPFTVLHLAVVYAVLSDYPGHALHPQLATHRSFQS